MKELLKTTASVLRKQKMPSTALETVHEAMRAAKAPLDNILGLKEENLFRQEILLERNEADVRKDYPQTYAVIAHLLNEGNKNNAAIDLGSISLVRNAVMVKNQEGKLTRVLGKQMKGREEVLSYAMKELQITKPEQFLPKLGDIVKSGRKLWISSNILDFLTASSNASFTSCHGFDGCHFNGNLAYARDGITLVTFVTEEKAKVTDNELYKLGRSWLFVKDNVIIQPKSYGAYYDFERDTARMFIEQKIAEALNVPNKWKIKRGQSLGDVTFEKAKDDYNNGQGALYLDNYALDMAYLGDTLHIPEIEFSAAMCLECGTTTDYRIKGVCSEHDGKIKMPCTICGESHLVDRMYTVDDGSCCRNCYDKHYAQCVHCGQAHKKANLENIDGYNTCKPCKERHYVKCSCCDSYSKKDRLADLKGIGKVCSKCQDKFLLCSICGNFHPKEEVEYYKYVGRVCSKCLPKHTFTCSGCGEVHPKGDSKASKKMSGEELICPACVARRNGEEIQLKTKPKYANLPEGWDDFIEEVG